MGGMIMPEAKFTRSINSKGNKKKRFSKLPCLVLALEP